jgi:single-strand DNA-binding protein
MPDPGNRAPSGIDAWPSGNSPISPAPFPKAPHVAVEGELRSHEYQRELAVGTQKTTLTQRVWEVRVDSVLKLDRAAKRETSDENQEEVPR